MAELGGVIRGRDQWEAKANEAISIYLVRSAENLHEGLFHPEFAHQIFGDDELILGYSRLSVKLYFTAGSLRCLVQIKYADRYQGTEFPVTDIEKQLAEWIPAGYTLVEDEFRQWVEADAAKFRPVGEKHHEYQLEDPARKYIITKGTMDTPGLRKFHERLQTFAIFEIDAARFLDEDPRWEFFYLFEETKGADGEPRYATVGYATWYRFFHYPDSIRPRISQFLIMPPHRKTGHGKRLYETIFADLVARKDVADIAVEDPAEGFQHMRTLADLKYLRTNKLVSGPALEVLPAKEKLQELQKKTKLSPRQLVHCLEIIACKEIKNNQTQLKKLKLHLKRRFFREDEALGAVDKAERYEKLDAMCKELLDEYKAFLPHV